MVSKFETKDIFRRQSIELRDHQISITRHDLFIGKETWFHKLDEISHRYETNSKVYSGGGCFPVLILFSVFFVWIIWGASFLLLVPIVMILILAFLSPQFFFKRTMLEIKTKGKPIFLILNRKNHDQGIEFANQLIQASKNYLKNKYGFVDEDLPSKMQFKNYLWLWQNDIISESEYADLKKSLGELLQNKTK
ncbi:MAG: hypothetical protein AAGG68_05780 [Bacteroidota bacterium]